MIVFLHFYVIKKNEKLGQPIKKENLKNGIFCFKFRRNYFFFKSGERPITEISYLKKIPEIPENN